MGLSSRSSFGRTQETSRILWDVLVTTMDHGYCLCDHFHAEDSVGRPCPLHEPEGYLVWEEASGVHRRIIEGQQNTWIAMHFDEVWKCHRRDGLPAYVRFNEKRQVLTCRWYVRGYLVPDRIVLGDRLYWDGRISP